MKIIHYYLGVVKCFVSLVLYHALDIGLWLCYHVCMDELKELTLREAADALCTTKPTVKRLVDMGTVSHRTKESHTVHPMYMIPVGDVLNVANLKIEALQAELSNKIEARNKYLLFVSPIGDTNLSPTSSFSLDDSTVHEAVESPEP